MNGRRYEYVSNWCLDAPLADVWGALTDVDGWPQWWPHVRAVQTLHRGDADGLGSLRRIRWSSRLPYGFTLRVATTQVEPQGRLVGQATGDMAGTGVWELWREGAVTRVRYTWELALHTRWMRLAAPWMAPVFRWNHEGVMRSGAQGLARYLAGAQAMRIAQPRAQVR
jgi:uncharacterized protein YndB with AHSA1/START domain